MKVKGYLAREVPKDMLFEMVVMCSVIPGRHYSDPGIFLSKISVKLLNPHTALKSLANVKNS